MRLSVFDHGLQKRVEPVGGRAILRLPLCGVPKLEQSGRRFGRFDCDLFEKHQSQIVDRLIAQGVPAPFFPVSGTAWRCAQECAAATDDQSARCRPNSMNSKINGNVLVTFGRTKRHQMP